MYTQTLKRIPGRKPKLGKVLNTYRFPCGGVQIRLARTRYWILFVAFVVCGFLIELNYGFVAPISWVWLAVLHMKTDT